MEGNKDSEAEKLSVQYIRCDKIIPPTYPPIISRISLSTWTSSSHPALLVVEAAVAAVLVSFSSAGSIFVSALSELPIVKGRAGATGRVMAGAG